jgi:hypothetical protein
LEADLDDMATKLEAKGLPREAIGDQLKLRLRTIGSEVEAELKSGEPSPNAFWTRE